jgi:serine/threonine protein kinase/tetratricopeptide (TPR) repeat protein
MKCPKCQFDNPETSQFCAACGAALATLGPERGSSQPSVPPPSTRSSHSPSPPPTPSSASAPSAPPPAPSAPTPATTPTQTLRREVKDITPGALIGGKYRLLEELGSGGMGVVYLADQVEPVERRVALKIIKLGMDTRQVVTRFETERQALAVMDHPNIAKVFDAGATETGRPYFVMELARGIPITDYCDRHKLPTRERLELFIAVCQAVQHAHQKGVIHRDLKPSNILVVIQDDRPVPKIIDFGIAKATDHRLSQRTLFTEQGQLIGTPEYMSPEQAEMSGLDVDTRTDVYSLGVILYELLVGLLPFDAQKLRSAGFGEIQRIIRETEPPKASTRLSTQKETKAEIAEKRRTDPGSLVKLLRGDLDWITMKAMAKDRTHRYSTASELAADIERHLRHEPVSAGPPSTVYRVRKYIRRHKLGVAAAGAIMLAVLIGIAGTTIGLLRAVRAEKKAVDEAATAQRVSDFLVELFEVSDPSEARGNTVTAREILDKGAAKIGQELEAQPLVRARLMETIGTVYRSLGLYEQAKPMLEKALKLKKSIYGDDNLSVADTLHNLGIIYDDQGKYEEAASFFRQSLDIRSRKLGPDDPEVARSLNSLAIVYWNQEKYAEAEPLFERSLAIKEKTLGPDHPDLANTLINLGILKHTERKYEEAEALFKRALAISEKKLGPEHPDLGTILNNLAALYEDQNRRAEAEPLYLRCLAIWEKALGPDHPDVAIAVHNLANLYRNLGRYVEAEPLYLRSLAIWEKALGPDHPYVGISLRERANLYRDQGRYAEAEPLYVRSLRIFEKNPEANRFNTAETLENYILLLRKMDRAQEALNLESRLKALRGQ